MSYTDKTLTAGGETPAFTIIGNCDILIKGLTAGSVKLQYLLPPSTENPSPTWEDWPSSDGEFTEDGWSTVFLSESNIRFKLVGSSNNAGAYVRFGRFLND